MEITSRTIDGALTYFYDNSARATKLFATDFTYDGDDSDLGVWLCSKYKVLAQQSMLIRSGYTTNTVDQIKNCAAQLSKYYNPKAKQIGNWWEWYIGAPLYYALTHLYCAFEDKNFLPTIDHFTRKKVKWGDLTCANLATGCKILLVAGIATNQPKRVIEAMDLAVPAYTIKSVTKVKIARALQRFSVSHPKLPMPVSMFSNKDGLYSDCSFLQHTSVPSICTYGLEMIQFANAINATVGVGYMPTAMFVTLKTWLSAFDLAVFDDRPEHMFFGRSFGAACSDETARNINNECNLLRNSIFRTNPFDGDFSHVLANCDRVVHQIGDYRFCLAMSSDRVARFESLRNNNPYGSLLGDGVTYIYKKGYSATSDFGYYDLTQLPGVTKVKNNVLMASEDCVQPRFDYTEADMRIMRAGGASLKTPANSSVAGMRFSHNGCVADKSWHMFDDCVVCLGSGIQCKSHTVTIVYSSKTDKPQLIKTDRKNPVAFYPSLGIIIISLFGEMSYDESTGTLYIEHTPETIGYYGYQIVPNVTIDDVQTYKDGYSAEITEGIMHRVTHGNIETVFSFSGKEKFGDWTMVRRDIEDDITEFCVSDYTQEQDILRICIAGVYRLASATDGIITTTDSDLFRTTISIDTKNTLGAGIKFRLKKIL